MFTLLSLKRYCSRSGVEFSQIADFSKLPIFYLPTGDTTKSAEDREVKESGEEDEFSVGNEKPEKTAHAKREGGSTT
jgi:hypothetical protein